MFNLVLKWDKLHPMFLFLFLTSCDRTVGTIIQFHWITRSRYDFLIIIIALRFVRDDALCTRNLTLKAIKLTFECLPCNRVSSLFGHTPHTHTPRPIIQDQNITIPIRKFNFNYKTWNKQNKKWMNHRDVLTVAGHRMHMTLNNN